MLPDLALFLNTHSRYADLWPAFFGRWSRHAGDLRKCPAVAASDVDVVRGGTDIGQWTPYRYNGDRSFSEQYGDSLAAVTREFVLTLQEDYLLYGDVDVSRLASHIAFLDAHPEYYYVRLILSGQGKLIPIGDQRFEIHREFFPWYSMQPTIWRTKSLAEIYSTMRPCNPWEAEPEGEKFTRANGIKGVLSYRGEKPRGRMHNDSSEFPYICTAVVKGHWNTSEYPTELAAVFAEYGIDPRERGET